MKKLFITTTILATNGIASLLLGTLSAQAQLATGTMGVSASVIEACTLSNDDIAFGDYNPLLNTPTDTTATINVNCTTGTPYQVKLGEGNQGYDSNNYRQMTNGGSSRLLYNLYTDNSRTTIWDETDNRVTQTGDGSNQEFTVYGRIPENQNLVSVGDYSDSVSITVELQLSEERPPE